MKITGMLGIFFFNYNDNYKYESHIIMVDLAHRATLLITKIWLVNTENALNVKKKYIYTLHKYRWKI